MIIEPEPLRLSLEDKRDLACWGKWFSETYQPLAASSAVITLWLHNERIQFGPDPGLHESLMDIDYCVRDLAPEDQALLAIKYCWLRHADTRRVTDGDRAKQFGIARRTLMARLSNLKGRLAELLYVDEDDWDETDPMAPPSESAYRGEALVSFIVDELRRCRSVRRALGIDSLPSSGEFGVCLTENFGISRSAYYRALKKANQRGLLPRNFRFSRRNRHKKLTP